MVEKTQNFKSLIFFIRAYVTLKGFDKNGRRVFLFQTAKIDPNKHKIDDLYRAHFLLMEILMEKLDQSSVTGFITASDMKNSTMSHMTMMSNPVTMKKSTTVFQDAYPIRPKAMHLLNMPGFMENLLTLFKSLLNEKMKERFVVHSLNDYSKLVEACGKEVLPQELGGDNGNLQDHMGKCFKYEHFLAFCLETVRRDRYKFRLM